MHVNGMGSNFADVSTTMTFVFVYYYVKDIISKLPKLISQVALKYCEFVLV